MRGIRNLTLTTAIASGSAILLTAPSAMAAAVTMQAQAAQQAEGFANSAAYNGGFGRVSGQENHLTTSSNRDPNGNMLIVNGIMTGAGSVNQQDGLNQSGASGIGGASATAVGNSLNVTVTGAWNTVIVDSTQINNGDQNASASLNGNLKF
jgi:holdfast attachment protein HfaA